MTTTIASADTIAAIRARHVQCDCGYGSPHCRCTQSAWPCTSEESILLNSHDALRDLAVRLVVALDFALNARLHPSRPKGSAAEDGIHPMEAVELGQALLASEDVRALGGDER